MAYDSVFYMLLAEEAQRLGRDHQRADFVAHLDSILGGFQSIEHRMILVRYADQRDDLLYKAFVRYEQLKIFMEKNLDYLREIFTTPMYDFKKHLRIIQERMLA